MNIKIPSLTPADTFCLGEAIGRQLKGNEILFLQGELGAGKTILTKGIARALGINPDDVVSPTFTLVNEFRGLPGDDNDGVNSHRPVGGHRLYHVDLYRLGPSREGHLPEIDDYIGEGVIVVEWAQYLDPSYFKLARSIEIIFHLSPGDENHRLLEIKTVLKLTI